MGSRDIELIIEKFELEFLPERNGAAEWGIKFPVFLTSFYRFLYRKKDVPRQPAFYAYYLEENKEYFLQNKYSPEILSGLKARIYRTYPSLIRDLHFNFKVHENMSDALVIYNRKLDIEEGIDLMIHSGNKYFAFNLYTDTIRGRSGREKKVSRHTPFDNVKYVELPVNFNGSVKCGRFFLYGEKELAKLRESLLCL